MRVALIAAWSDGRVIGRDGRLPWHLPADLARFRALTTGHHLIVGRRTWESIGRPLPERRILVITSSDPELPPGVRAAPSPEAALELAEAAGDGEPFVAGGRRVYEATLPRADRLYLTRVHAELPGDTHFPPIDLSQWRQLERHDHPADERHAWPYSFLVYERADG